MQSRIPLLIALIPVYITLAFYLNLIPQSAVTNLSSLLRLAKANLRAQQIQEAFARHFSSENTTTAPTMSPLRFLARRSEERGHADHDWLKTFHTFSFAGYQSNAHEQYGPLRVMNEDRVAARTGFGAHSHREFEIFSYVVAGELEHKDSMGNIEILKRGDLQLTSAGTGISHSEKAHGSKQVHFLQIWSVPRTSRLPPKYFTRHFTDAQKKDNWVKVVAPIDSEGVSGDREAEGPAPVQSALTLYASMISPGKSPSYQFQGKKGYVHVVQTSGYNPKKATGATVKISGAGGVELELKEGDGAYVVVDTQGAKIQFDNIGEKVAEVLLFDLE